MIQLTIPFELNELNKLLNHELVYHKRFEVTGVSHATILQCVLWVDVLIPIHTYLYPDDSTTMSQVQDIVDTITGIWQISKLSTLGKAYTISLLDKYIKPEDNNDLLIIARRIKNMISTGTGGYDESIVMGSAGALIHSRYNLYYHPTHSPDIDFEFISGDYFVKTRSLYIGLEFIYSRMIENVIVGLPNTCNEEFKLLLNSYIDAYKKFPTAPHYINDILLNKIETYLGVDKVIIRKNKLKSTKLRIVK